MQNKIVSNDLGRQFYKYQQEYEDKALEVLRSGWYVLGREVEAFEREFAAYVGTRYCVGLASGLDALWLSFRILGIGKGDEVLTPANTYIASIMGITINDATPVFVEPNSFYNIDPDKIEESITPRTKAILAVHLYGQACAMDKLRAICDRHGLYLIEDCAQSHGARCCGVMTGALSDIGCFSFYPSKNLGGFGDGGAITTDNEEIARKFRIYRNYGSEKRYYNMVVGANSRLDELQAGLLRVKLRHLPELNDERTRLAQRYLREVKNPCLILPQVAYGCTSVWHLFVIRTDYRKQLEDYLNDNGVQTIVHYPIPPHLSDAYRSLGHSRGAFPLTEYYADTVITLPLYIGMTAEEQETVIRLLNEFVPRLS